METQLPHGKGHISPTPYFSADVYCGQTVAHLSYCWALVKLQEHGTDRWTDSSFNECHPPPTLVAGGKTRGRLTHLFMMTNCTSTSSRSLCRKSDMKLDTDSYVMWPHKTICLYIKARRIQRPITANSTTHNHARRSAALTFAHTGCGGPRHRNARHRIRCQRAFSTRYNLQRNVNMFRPIPVILVLEWYIWPSLCLLNNTAAFRRTTFESALHVNVGKYEFCVVVCLSCL